MKKLLLILTAFICLTASAGTKYYPTPTNDGGGRGGRIYGAGAFAPGDTISIKEGVNAVFGGINFAYIFMANLQGTEANPIVIMNEGSINMYGGVSMESCKWIKVIGFNVGGTRGFRIGEPTAATWSYFNGAGIAFNGLNEHIEINNVWVKWKTFALTIKNEVQNNYPDSACNGAWWYPAKQRHIKVTNCLFEDAKSDIVYIGSSDPRNRARPIVCGGVSINPWPTGVAQVEFSYNTIRNGGRSGIQIGQTDTARFHHNTISECGKELDPQQGAGIALGTGAQNICVDSNTFFKTYIHGFYSYHQGKLQLIGNSFDSTGWVMKADSSGNASLSYVTSNVRLDPHDSDNTDSTRFVICGNTFGKSTDANIAIAFDSEMDLYGTPNYLWSNTKNGSAVTGSNIYVAPSVPNTLTYNTTAAPGGCVVQGFSSSSNPPPTANAGSDQSVTVDNVTLSGSGTAGAGSITAYNWSKLSGPSSYAIDAPSTATTPATNLVTGVYVFRLTVTQTDGQTATDNVQVTVAIPAPPPTGKKHLRAGRRK